MKFKITALKKSLTWNGVVPDEIQICCEGEVRLDGEDNIWFTKESAELVMAHFRSLGHKVVIDYEHQTLMGGEAPAAGWINELQWRGPGEKGGLWAKVEWTEKAAKFIEDGEYRYHSPVFLARPSDQVVTLLYNLALTNQPKMMDVAALAAKHIHLNQGDEDMKFSEKVAAVLKLGADATEDDVLKALKALAASAEAKDTELKELKDSLGDDAVMPVVLKGLGLDSTATGDDVDKAIKALKASDTTATELGKTVADLQTKIAQMQGDDMVQKALKNGQLSPDEAAKWGNDLAADNPEQFKTIVLSRKPGSVVPLKDLGVKKDNPSDVKVAGDVQMSVNKMMGVSQETFKKYGPGAEGGE
jgi:Mu-like prophage I protein